MHTHEVRLLAHLFLHLGVDIVELLLQRHIVCHHATVTLAELLEHALALGKGVAICLLTGCIVAHALLQRLDLGNECLDLLAQGRCTRIGLRDEGLHGFDVLSNTADADVQLGQLTLDLRFPVKQRVSLYVLIGTQRGKCLDLSTQRDLALSKRCKLLVVARALTLQRIEIVT